MIETADIEVIMPGMLEVLSVGKGDIRLVVGGADPEEIESARKIIKEMLAKGYGLFVEEADGTLKRVKRFNAKKMVYVISEIDDESKKVVDKEVALAGSKAKAIGKTAGG